MNKLIHGPNVAGQSIIDRVMSAKHTIAGQDLEKAVFKATTEELMGPKRKHLDYLIWCSNNANISIPEMANQLIGRTTNSNWIVVFKALITIHDLMNYGNERFTQYLASSNCTFALSTFLDRTSTLGYEMSVFIRRYSDYITQKAVSYRLMGYDFCKVRRGKEDGVLRKMDTHKLLKGLPILQQQLDVLLNFNVTSTELNNGVINVSFLALFKDLIRLFACYNDGIINLLEKYFEMDRRQCAEAFDVYKKFVNRMDSVQAILRTAELMGIDKQEIPDLAKAPASLCEALEEHLKSLETNKMSGVASSVPKRPMSGVTTAINNFTVAAQMGAAPGAGAGAFTITEVERNKILEEEQKQLDQLKKEKMRSQQTATSPTQAFRPVASARTTVATPTVAARTTLTTPPVAVPRSSSGNNTVETLAASNKMKVSNTQELELAFREHERQPEVKPLAPPPPGFNSFGDVLKPTVMHANSSSKTIDLASLNLNDMQPKVNPLNVYSSTNTYSSASYNAMSTANTGTMSSAIVIPISTLNPTYRMPMMQPSYHNVAANQYWMQPRMMMLGQPTLGWNPIQQGGPGGPPLHQRPTFQEIKPNDPFGVL